MDFKDFIEDYDNNHKQPMSLEKEDRDVLYEIRDALLGTFEKPGLITKVSKQDNDIYGEPNGLISRMGRMQHQQERFKDEIEEGKNKFKGGWMVLGWLFTTIGLLGSGIAWLVTIFKKKP